MVQVGRGRQGDIHTGQKAQKPRITWLVWDSLAIAILLEVLLEQLQQAMGLVQVIGA